jgi:hypothetical protein
MTPTMCRRRLGALAIGVTTVVMLTACGGAGTRASEDYPTPSGSPAPTGVVTQGAAKKIVDNYEKVNNRANATQDQKLLSTVEAGQVHEQSTADYDTFKTRSAEDQKRYETPFHYRDRDYMIPREGRASWFAVEARAVQEGEDRKDTEDRSLLVFDKIGGTYKLVMGVNAEDGSLPQVARDKSGLVTAVDPSKKVGPLAPSDLDTAFPDLFATGGKKDGKQLAATRPVKQSVAHYEKRNSGDLAAQATVAYFPVQPKHQKVYALKATDGSVVAVFGTAHTVETLLKPAYMSSADLVPGEKQAAFNPAKRKIITDEYQGQGIAEMPATGKARVIGREYKMVDSR